MYTDLETWLLDVGYDRVFRMWKLRRVGDWTPLELEKKYMDQSKYEDDTATTIKIKEVITLPNKDLLIGYSYYDTDKDFYSEDVKEEPEYIEYCLFSEIKLAYSENDNKPFDDEEEDFEE